MRSKIYASQPQTDLLILTECDDLLPDLTLRPAVLA